jgi:hypothetical protein
MSVLIFGAGLATERLIRHSLEGAITTGPTPEPEDAGMPGTTAARRGMLGGEERRAGTRRLGVLRRAAAALAVRAAAGRATTT